jgi:hypothetical protein
MVRGSGTNDHSLARVLTHAGDTLKARLTLAWALGPAGQEGGMPIFLLFANSYFRLTDFLHPLLR